jgi:hypothetical protein
MQDIVDGEGAFIVYPPLVDDAIFGDVLRHHYETHRAAGADAAAMKPDFPNGNAFGDREIPDGMHVLFASIGHILFNLVTSTDERTQLHSHLVESAADIPTYLRDKYRAQLPFFRAAFHSLANKCEFYKRIMEQTSPECFRSEVPIGGASYNKVGYKFTGHPHERIIGILKTVATGTSALVQDCTRTLTDIGDQPRYFEVSADSINAYRSQNNGDPIMPLTALLRVANRERALPVTKLMPEMRPMHSFGDPSFKFQYAIRGLYHNMKTGKEVVAPLQSLAALDSMVTMFNKYSHGGIKIDAALAQELASTIVTGFDFVHDVMRVKHYTTIVTNQVLTSAVAQSHTMPLQASLVGVARTSKVAMNKVARILTTVPLEDKEEREVPPSFGLRATDISNIINIVENRNREDAMTQVINGTLGHKSQVNDPIIANIVDMNIIPFDLHVLARQMPLHFIWNYAFTFDSIVGTMVYDKMAPSKVMDAYFTGCRDDDRTGPVGPNVVAQITTARDALFALLTEPYRTFSEAEKRLVMQVLVGAVGIPEFDRPKFLSDQIANKIFLAATHSPATMEVGPQGAIITQAITTALGVVSNDGNEVAEFNQTLQSFANATKIMDDASLRGMITSLNLARPNDQNTTRLPVDYKSLVIARVANYVSRLSGGGDVIPPATGTAAVTGVVNGSPSQIVKSIIHEYANIIVEHGDIVISAVILAIEHTKSIYPRFADAWKRFISRQRFNGVLGVPDAQQGDITLARNNMTSLMTDVPMRHQYAPHTDEYGLTTTAGIPTIPNAKIVGNMRMDTLLARNLIHIGLVLNIVQMRLHSDVTYARGRPVAESMGTLNPSIYKFFGNQSIDDTAGPKYGGPVPQRYI